MLTELLYKLKKADVPVSIREYLTLLSALDLGLANYRTEDFYLLSRTSLIKDERYLDKFDRIFGEVFRGENSSSQHENLYYDIPDNWIKKLFENTISDEEKKKIESIGGWEELINGLRKRLDEQKNRHQGGNKWIGTSGTSPYGAFGYNPEGVRIGQHESRNRRAVKIWEKRTFRDLDDDVEIGTRNIKLALRTLRRFARDRAGEVLDLPDTIRSTAHNGGMLKIKMTPERTNAVKILLLIDVGGSMDDWVKVCTELFSAARSEFKNLEYYYFHNCVYDSIWRHNSRRHQEEIATEDLLNRYSPEWKLIFVGDASMSPYEILMAGGSVEHWNTEPGQVWLERLLNAFKYAAWINPVRQDYWRFTQSIEIIRNCMAGRMFPLTLNGIDLAMRELK